MNTLYRHLETDLTLGLKAWRRSRWQRGMAISLLGLLAGAVLIFLSTPALAAFPALWWFVLGAATIGWIALTVQYLILPLRHRPSLTQIARYLEEQNPDLEDRLATAVEFGRHAPDSPIRRRASEPQPDPHALLRRLLQDAISRTTQIDFSRQLQLRFAAAWRALSSVATVLALVAFFGYSGMFRQRLEQLWTTVQNAPKVLRGLQVTPGDARVRRGEAVDIVAQSPDAAVEKAFIYIATGKTARLNEGDWSPNEMEATTQVGKFLYRLFDVRDTLRYYVRVENEFSPIYTIIPLEAPEIKTLRLTFHFPTEMGLPAKHEAGTGDVYAPAGTRVDLSIVASQPLARAEWQLGGNAVQTMRITADTLAHISFTIARDESYVVRLANADGLTNVSPEYFIHVTPDEAPLITITRPGRDTRPTMLEETPVAAQVRDDFGLRQFDLIYAINDQPPARQDILPTAARGSDHPSSQLDYRGETLLFLEQLKVQPGDFISYYFEAADARQKASTDLYFLEVRPFEEEFYRALSQGGSGGENSSGLAVSQKEIITATWKLERARQKMSRDELQQGSKAIAETQADLKESVARIAQGARMGGGLTEEMGGGKIIKFLEDAVVAMGEAVPLLEEVKLTEALDPERRAYQLLLKVDAERRRRELAMGGGGASGFGQLQSSEELARLFEDELNKIQSKYETLQNQQQQQQATQLNEALQKVKELAQRQERLNDLSRMMQRENQSPEEKKRQIERLRRQQDELNREVQNLARQMHQLGQSSQGNQQSLQQLEDNLRQTADDMKRTTDNLRRENLANAGAEGNRALDRLRRLEEQLQQQRSNSTRENLSQLREEMQQLAESQKQLSDDLQRQGSSAPAAGAEQRGQWQERQQELQRRANRAREDLQKAQENTRRAAGEEAMAGQEKSAREKQKLSQDLRKLGEEFDRRRILERMEQAGEAIQQERLSDAERAQKEAAQSLKKLEEQLGESLSQLAEAPEEKLDLALQETQRLRRELEESLREGSAATPSGQQQPGGRSDSPSNRTSEGRGGQNPSSQLAPNGAPSGGNPSDEMLRPEEMNWWSERAWQGIRNLEKISPFLRADTSLADDYARLMQNYRGLLRTFRGGDPLKREQIEKQLIDPLRRFEAELATRLAVLQHQQNILTVRDEPVPPQYREMVDKYFEMLSKKR
ncbi:hypothetical protein L0337_02880 [candidate division KSB1 bacterium]|nr:hypothetical protein [candidate division KSB1 bacterium]